MKFFGMNSLILSALVTYFHATVPTSEAAFAHNKLILDRTSYCTKTSTSRTALFVTAKKESEAEALLRKAREMRAQVEAAEDALHTSLLEKKSRHDTKIDVVIDKLFPPGEADDDSQSQLLERLHVKNRPSTGVLEEVVQRLHDREVAAKGAKRVELSSVQPSKFDVVSQVNEEELLRVQGLIDRLISAAKIVDEEAKREKKEHHASDNHFTEGDLAGILRDKAKFLGREHDESFKKRLQEFYDSVLHKKGFSEENL